MKALYTISILVFGTIGGGLGNLLDHQSFFAFGLGGWSILLTAVGSFGGIWVVYHFRDYF